MGICAPNSAKPLAVESGAHGSRLGRRGDDIAGQAKLAFAEEEHGFVLAHLVRRHGHFYLSVLLPNKSFATKKRHT